MRHAISWQLLDGAGPPQNRYYHSNPRFFGEVNVVLALKVLTQPLILKDQTTHWQRQWPYQSDLVMYDHKIGYYWVQVAGEAIVDKMTGRTLKLLPSMTIPWSRWKDTHPNTKLLVRGSRDELPFEESYASDPFYDLDSIVGIGGVLPRIPG